jgi:hypothetical protein
MVRQLFRSRILVIRSLTIVLHVTGYLLSGAQKWQARLGLKEFRNFAAFILINEIHSQRPTCTDTLHWLTVTQSQVRAARKYADTPSSSTPTPTTPPSTCRPEGRSHL